jgi:hypothetical protein
MVELFEDLLRVTDKRGGPKKAGGVDMLKNMCECFIFCQSLQVLFLEKHPGFLKMHLDKLVIDIGQDPVHVYCDFFHVRRTVSGFFFVQCIH